MDRERARELMSVMLTGGYRLDARWSRRIGVFRRQHGPETTQATQSSDELRRFFLSLL